MNIPPSPQFLLHTHHSHIFLCISAVSISRKVIKKHNPKAFIWANVYTDTMFPRAFCILTMGRQTITSSQEHTSIFTHRLRAYTWFAALPNTRGIIVNMKSATGMKPTLSYFFPGESKTSIMLSQSCQHTTMLLHVHHTESSGVRHLTIFWGLEAVYLSGPWKFMHASFI